MHARAIIQRLAYNAPLFEGIGTGLSTEQARHKPTPERWSILEVLRHLLDEERDDFRKRLDLTLHQPGTAWPGIDPEAWAIERNYNDADWQETLTLLLEERQGSLAWLQGLTEPDWSRAYAHPTIGAITAGDLLAAWAAHDFLHLRQLAALQVDLIARLAEPHSIRYATP